MPKHPTPGMSIVVKTVTRLTVWLILVYGIYIVFHGHVSPGGGFAGGVIIALSFIHLVLAYGKEMVLQKLTDTVVGAWESAGALVFLGIALMGLLAGYFFKNFLSTGEPFNLFSGGTIPLSYIAISMKVWAGLFAIFVALVLLHIDDEKE